MEVGFQAFSSGAVEEAIAVEFRFYPGSTRAVEVGLRAVGGRTVEVGSQAFPARTIEVGFQDSRQKARTIEIPRETCPIEAGFQASPAVSANPSSPGKDLFRK